MIRTKSEIYEIWDLNRPKLFSFVRKKVQSGNDAEDILQDVFIKLWTRNHEIKERDKIINWLFSVAKFTIADYYRKKARSKISYPL